MNKISKRNIEIEIKEEFIREDEIISLVGSKEKLSKFIDHEFAYEIQETLAWMYFNEKDENLYRS